MTEVNDAEVILTVAPDKISEVEFKGEKMIQVRTGLTTEEFLRMFLRFSVSDDRVAVVRGRKDDGEGEEE